MKLLIYIARRLLLMLIVMAGVATIVFFVTRIIPADPVGAILGGNAPIELVDKMRADLGLDKPLFEQFIVYISGIVKGDFGKSMITHKPVLEDILEFMPATIELAMASMVFTILFGIIFGAISAVKRNKPIDHVMRVFSIMGVSLPVFWLGLIFLFVFYFYLDWLPGSGRHSMFVFPERITGFIFLDSILQNDWDTFGDALAHILMPAFVLGYASAATVARIMRASMLDVMAQNFIRTARSKGLGRWVVIYRHAMRNALIPVITVIGVSFGDLLSGAVLTETIFSWPGLGRYIVNALLKLDYPAVTGGTLFVAFIYSLANLMVDISYAALDPRIKQ